jgi:hypothetical protein
MVEQYTTNCSKPIPTKMSAKKIHKAVYNRSPLIPRYAGIRRTSTKESRLHAKHMEKNVSNLNNTIPHSERLVDPTLAMMI